MLFITEASGGFKAIYRSFKLLNDRMGREKDKDGGWEGASPGDSKSWLDVFSDYCHASIFVTWTAWLFGVCCLSAFVCVLH